jgi:hypothetical protein
MAAIVGRQIDAIGLVVGGDQEAGTNEVFAEPRSERNQPHSTKPFLIWRLTRSARGTFEAAPSVGRYIAYRVEATEKAAELATGGREYSAARTRYMIARAAAAEQARQQSEESYWPEDRVKLFASALTVQFKDNVRALPNAITPELFACKTMPEMAQLLLKRIDAMLTRLAVRKWDDDAEIEYETDYQNIQL